MSQFFGCIALNKTIDIQEVADKMQQNMSFFKGDGTGIYQTESVFICNKLLHNTPESINTPLICQNERYVLAATCRLDNREELATKLSLNDPIKASDHEYLLAAYSQFQETCVEHLLGDFSFVIWDKQEEKLFMAKDHLGVKPLFYYKDDNILLFSTSITGIKTVFSEPLAINQLYITYILKNYIPPVELTFFELIYRLKPAHYYCLNRRTETSIEKNYWKLSPIAISEFETDEERLKELRKIFFQAVSCRTRTYKKVGSQLSGGLDSSAITVLVSQMIPKENLHTYSFVLNEKTRAYSELGIDEQETQNAIIRFADLISKNHHPIEDFHFKDVFEEMRHSNLIMGGYDHSDCIWQATLFKEAQKSNVGFIFSGFPGDECISNSGTFYYYDYIYHKNWKKLWQFLKEFRLRAIKRILMYFISKQVGTHFIGYIKLQKQRDLLDSTSKWNKRMWSKKEMFGTYTFYPSFKQQLIELVCREHVCFRTESENAYALQYGIETTYPLADIRLLQLAISLPVEMFKPSPLPRALFRKLCNTILPDSVLLQNKNNGASTLAFFDYIKQKQLSEAKDYVLNNIQTIFNEKRSAELSTIDQLLIKFKLIKIDFLMELNKHFR